LPQVHVHSGQRICKVVALARDCGQFRFLLARGKGHWSAPVYGITPQAMPLDPSSGDNDAIARGRPSKPLGPAHVQWPAVNRFARNRLETGINSSGIL
jgi:hypothetical protein